MPVFAGILARVLIFTASILLTTFLIELASTGKRRWVSAVVIGPAVIVFVFNPGLIVSIFQSLSTGLSWKSIMISIFGGVAAGAALSAV